MERGAPVTGGAPRRSSHTEQQARTRGGRAHPSPARPRHLPQEGKREGGGGCNGHYVREENVMRKYTVNI